MSLLTVPVHLVSCSLGRGDRKWSLHLTGPCLVKVQIGVDMPHQTPRRDYARQRGGGWRAAEGPRWTQGLATVD